MISMREMFSLIHLESEFWKNCTQNIVLLYILEPVFTNSTRIMELPPQGSSSVPQLSSTSRWRLFLFQHLLPYLARYGSWNHEDTDTNNWKITVIILVWMFTNASKMTHGIKIWARFFKKLKEYIFSTLGLVRHFHLIYLTGLLWV